MQENQSGRHTGEATFGAAVLSATETMYKDKKTQIKSIMQ